MKTIPLTQGKQAYVSNRDFAYLSNFKWQAKRDKNKWYAVRSDPSGRTVRMHREILGLLDSSLEGDHRDGNGLNNQRRNLREATRSQNAHNTKSSGGSASGLKGVYPKNGKWEAKIKSGQKLIFLGMFENKLDAALAYDRAARKHFGKFARTNL